jgi:hypothetical protein
MVLKLGVKTANGAVSVTSDALPGTAAWLLI